MRKLSPLQKNSISQRPLTNKIYDLTSEYTDEKISKFKQGMS